MRVIKFMPFFYCSGRLFSARSVIRGCSSAALFVSIFFLTTFGSAMCVRAETPPAIPGKVWYLVWEDHFKGTSIDTNYWNVYSKNKGWGSEKYRPGQVTVANSICTFTAVKEGNDYWSGGLTNKGKKGVISYGYYEMRCKLPEWTGGQWPAFWLVGCNGNWMPEFDIVDGTNWGNNCFWTNPHWRDSAGAHIQSGFSACPEGGNITADFHTYGFLWTKDSCVWYFDNKKIRFWKTDPIIPDCPNPIILNLEMGGWGGRTIDDSTLPWQMKIDWVRVWKIESDKQSRPNN
jgi:beta-glucanase (GH16 family)